MALKDWKKRAEGYWVKKKGDDALLIKYYSVFDNYDVQLNGYTIFSSAETKSQAIAYAKSYMRTH